MIAGSLPKPLTKALAVPSSAFTMPGIWATSISIAGWHKLTMLQINADPVQSGATPPSV